MTVTYQVENRPPVRVVCHSRYEVNQTVNMISSRRDPDLRVTITVGA